MYVCLQVHINNMYYILRIYVCTCTYIRTYNIKLLIQHVGLMDYLYVLLCFVSGDKPYGN